MRVSVLIPTLNRLPYLREAIASARAQTHADLEILVSDDGSRDGSRDYVASLAREDERVRLVTDNPAPGIFTNMNHLASRATGDAFCLLGDDDRLEPAYVAKLAAALVADPTAVVAFCDHWIIDATGDRRVEASDGGSRRYGRIDLPGGRVRDAVRTALDQTLCIGFALFRGAALPRPPFDVACGGAADVDFAITAAARGAFVYVPERLGEYRWHPGTATATKRLYMSSGVVHALSKHRFDDPAHERARTEHLRQASRVHAFDACTVDRRSALASVARYLRLGGSPLDPKIVASTALALSPAPVAAWVQREIVSRRWPEAARRA